MQNHSPLMIISLGNEQPAKLAELAQATGHSTAHIVGGGITESIKALNSRARAPELIIIDIIGRTPEVLTEIDQLAEHCEASVNVFAIGTINDIRFYRELKTRGILEYFTHPVTASDLSAAVTNMQQKNKTNNSMGKVIATMSAASGDGSSTLAMNLAYSFAADHKCPTVLVDMDYQFGLIAKTLDLTAPFGTRELFEHPDRGLDDLLMQKMLVKYQDNLSIISSPNELRFMPNIRPEVIEEMLQILRSRYKFVVVELPHIWTDWTAAVLKNSDQIMMVAQLWLRSLTHTTRMLNAWQAAGIDRTKVQLIINRSGAKFKEAISAEEFERICTQKINHYLNNDIKAVVGAENLGKTLIETAQGSVLQQQFRDISQNIITHFEGKQNITSSSKKGFMNIFDKKANG